MVAGRQQGALKKSWRSAGGEGVGAQRTHVTSDTVPAFSMHILSARWCASWAISEKISSSCSSIMASHCKNGVTA